MRLKQEEEERRRMQEAAMLKKQQQEEEERRQSEERRRKEQEELRKVGVWSRWLGSGILKWLLILEARDLEVILAVMCTT